MSDYDERAKTKALTELLDKMYPSGVKVEHTYGTTGCAHRHRCPACEINFFSRGFEEGWIAGILHSAKRNLPVKDSR